MATITLNVTNEINNEFRNIVKTKFGEGKGRIGRAIEEAMQIWIFKQKQKELSTKGLSLLKAGIWSKKNYKFNREEAYDR
jgi:hypothetical protein